MTSWLTDARAGAGRRLVQWLLLPWLAVGFVGGASAAESPAWDRTIERIAPSVVTIEIDQTRAFDTEWNQSSQATGFVVDAVRGLILTNRHVVTPGPVVATAVFQNREEVELHAVYRDPVHDFGIYRYDPAKLRYVQPVALPLYPAGARVGTEIRVVGNDAGEQLSILAGTLARLDRAAPEYGVGKYNDFNTFYVQAASGTSGGSSGSPVIDIQGRVVALNAGGSSGAQSSFYLPLDRVQRALQLIQRGEPVSRGTLQTVFNYTPYDELVRLGLRAVTQEAARKARPDLTGMLVVDEVLPGSPTEGKLQPGDILTHVNGQLITTFLPLEEILDNSVGGKVDIVVERGGEKVQQTLPVGDLHAITPSEFFEFGDAVVHTLSYQMARHFNAPVSGVYVANPGYVLNAAGVPRGAVISSVNGKPVATMAEFRDIIAALPQGARAALRYSTLDDPKGSETRVMRMDRAWFPAKVCRRDDKSGLWPCEELAAAPAAASVQPARTDFATGNDKRANEIAASLVLVTFDMPFSVAGITERNYHGTGIIVDAERGLVVVDRNTVPVAAGDVRLTFGGSIEVPGKVEYVHPLHNLSVVSFDPKALDGTPIRAVKFDTRELEPGEAVTVVGLGGDSRLRSLATYVATMDDVNFPLSRTLQFRDANLEVVSLVNSPSDFDGVITGKDGRVRALWSSFATEGARDAVQTQSRHAGIGRARGRGGRTRRQAALFARNRVRSAADRGRAQARAAGRVGREAGTAQPGAPPGARRLEGRGGLWRSQGAAGRRPAAGREWGDAQPVPRSGGGDAIAPRAGHGAARRRRKGRRRRDRRAAGRRHRSPAALGRRRDPCAASRDDDPACDPARGRVRGLFRLRFAVDALRIVCRAPHRRGGRPADCRPRRVHCRRERPARSFIGASQDGHLERLDRRDDDEARPELLAGV